MTSPAVGHHIAVDSIAGAWLSAAEYLLSSGREAFGLMVEVSSPAALQASDIACRSTLDQALRERDLQDTGTVANTIFPSAFASNGGPKALFATYDRNWPVIRALSPANARGTYFRRLTHARVVGRDDAVSTVNPLQLVIEKIKAQLASAGGTKRCIYPLSVYDAGTDRTMTMGFPCLSLIDLKIDGDRLHLFGQYRNQHFIRKALGNYLGLSALQSYVASEVGLQPGALLCLATHAELEAVRGSAQVVARCRAAWNEHE